MDATKFKLRDAVDILLDSKRPVFVKIWVLARLMAWMCLDQRPRRHDKKTGRLVQPNPHRTDAKLAGHLALASLLHRRLKPGSFDGDDDTLRGLLLLFLQSGGFGRFLKGPRGGRRWLKKIKTSIERLMYVRAIVSYLCRYEISGMDKTKFNIECAKNYIEKTDEELKARTFGKYWEQSKQAAPYIFAFYPLLTSIFAGSNSIDQFVDALEQLAKNDQQLNQLLGEAAYAADTLASSRARRVRQGDFKGVKRMEPQLAAFIADEVQIIGAVDARRPLSKKDLEDYRPKSITPPKAIRQ
jgi:hypothetical protein